MIHSSSYSIRNFDKAPLNFDSPYHIYVDEGIIVTIITLLSLKNKELNSLIPLNRSVTRL